MHPYLITCGGRVTKACLADPKTSNPSVFVSHSYVVTAPMLGDPPSTSEQHPDTKTGNAIAVAGPNFVGPLDPAIDLANSATDAKSSGSTNIRGARGVSFSTGFSP